jgi:hypothetical protein
MLVVMKNIRLNSLLVIMLLVGACAANAALYRGVDAEGNVVYSDRPFEDAEEFTPPAISVVDTPESKAAKKAAKKAAEVEKSAEFKYTDFDIASPANKETIRNQPDVVVSLKLKPGLNTAESHSIWLLLDGKPVVKNSKSLSLSLGRLIRGAHTLQAQVRDGNGKIVVRTRAVVVYIHQTSG